MPKVSIVIPVYKAEPYIEQCVRTLFGQTLDELEFIFVDDCSPDHSIEVMERVLTEYPDRKSQVKVIRHEVNQGVSFARQHGVDAATGEYIIHCDPDDWVELNMYEAMYDEARTKYADIVICDFNIYRNLKETIGHQKPEYLDSISVLEGISGRLSHRLHGSLCNKLLKTTCYKDTDFPNVDFCEDAYILFQILSTNQSISYLPKSFYHYRSDVPASLVKQIDHKANESDIRLIKALKELQKRSDDKRYNACIDSYIVRIIFTRAFSWGTISNKEFQTYYGSYVNCIEKNHDIKWRNKILLKIAMKGHYHIAHRILQTYATLKSFLLSRHK